MLLLVRFACLLVLMISLGTAVQSQPNKLVSKDTHEPYFFEHYSQEKGLSQGTV
jgi:hypothetical protein